MSDHDPPRLMDEGATPLERELLASWHEAQPSGRARARALALAGVAAGTAMGVASASAGASVAPAAKGAAGAVGGASVAPTAAVGAAVAAKWLVGAALVALAVAGLSRTAVPGSTAPASTPAAASTARAPSGEAVTPGGAEGALNATPPAPSAPAPSPPSQLPLVAPVRAPGATRASKSTLALELASLDRARRALTRSDGSSALALLDAHDATFADGALREEASVLRVQALVAVGRVAEANRVGARFLARFPSSPHAGRVRALTAEQARP